MKLEGKVALVTGGNRGIGEAIVRLFTDEGAKVVLCGRREALCKQVEESVLTSPTAIATGLRPVG